MAMLEQRDLPAILITGATNRRYLSGFTGSAGMLLIHRGGGHLITDFRYVEQAGREAPDYSVEQHRGQAGEALADLLAELGIQRVAFEPRHMPYSQYEELGRDIPGVSWYPADGLVEAVRLVKEADEISRIRRAAALADAAWEEILPAVRAGRREQDIALDLEFVMRRRGAQSLSFPLIVASGERSALPHGRASAKELEQGDFVTVDYGAVVDGYASDATRTVVIGPPDDRQREVYEVVRRAQEAALEALRPGKTGAEVDAVARSIIDDAGYGQYFGHGLGHGLGMEVHEGPRLSQVHGEDRLEPGMVVTVEPGIYIPGWGGVRIEDLVVVTEQGCEILTSPTKELVVQEV